MEFIADGLLDHQLKVTSSEHDSILSKFVSDKICPNGDIFTGYIHAMTGDLISGKRLYQREGVVYEGPFMNGVRHGTGAVCTHLDGSGKYLGSFVYDDFSHGTLVTMEATFTGDFKRNRFHGEGTLVYSNGTIYIGKFQKGLYHGKGVLTTANGNVYDGSFKEGKRDGYGVLRKNGIVSYQGDWRNDVKDGVGVESFPNGSFDGEFFEGQRHGKGTLTLPRAILTGPWKENTPLDGPGWKIHYPKVGINYTGGALALRPHGQGSLTLQNMDTKEILMFEGKFCCGLRHGNGKLNNIQGQWLGDLKVSELLLVQSDDETIKTQNIVLLTDANSSVDDLKPTAEADSETTPSLSSCSDSFSSNTSSSQCQLQQQEDGLTVFQNGDTFQGHLDPFQKKHGFGIETCAMTGAVYSGQWKDSKRHGRGTLSQPLSGVQFIGTFIEDVIEGQGSLRFPDGSTYNGNFQKGIFHGKGTFTDATNGTTYKGEFSNGMKSGNGKEFYGDGSVYHGEFCDNKRHGNGCLFRKNIENGKEEEELTYQGEWKRGCISGEGVRSNIETPCPGSYEGSFLDGKRHGHGTFNAKNGYTLEGEWKDDAPVDGDWVITCPNGSVYYGAATCVLGMPVANGFGTHNESNGDFYSGSFVNGRRHGSGLCVFSSGEQWDGKWEEGNFVKYGRPRP